MDFAMDRPYKRQRLSDPPEFALHHRREQNDLRLKSTFESIFEKYGKDFDGIGDEIDLETGEIIVNNGHILGMVNERDAGDLEIDSQDEEGDNDWSDGETDLTSSLLSEIRRRIDALGKGMAYEEGNFMEGEPQSEDEADSLLGSNDSLVGEDEAQPTLPATQAKSRSPDSLYDDEDEDELASSEMVWPTPGMAWPTPAKATPLGHTPWRSSPVKPVYKSHISVDPAWRAPPLPIDRKQVQWNKPVGLKTSREAKDLAKDLTEDYTGQYHPSRSPEFRTPLRQKAPLTGSQRDMRSLGHRRTSDGPKSMTSSSNTERVRSPRWTMAEDELLRQLRTTTTLMYRELKPYFPGRKTQAIMIHWSEMMRDDRDLDQPYETLEFITPLLSPRRRASANNRFYNSPAATSWVKSGSNGKSPAPKPAVFGSVDSRASNGHTIIPHRAISHQRIKQESPPQSVSLEIADTSDATEQSQGFLSSSPASYAGPWVPSKLAERWKSPNDEFKEEEHEAQAFVTALPLSGVENAQRDNANTAPRLTPQSSHSEAYESGSDKSTTKLGYLSRDAFSREYQDSTLKRTILRSSYQFDGSDDELSAPIKTVGFHKSQCQRASSSTSSELVLNRSSSSVSRSS